MYKIIEKKTIAKNKKSNRVSKLSTIKPPHRKHKCQLNFNTNKNWRRRKNFYLVNIGSNSIVCFFFYYTFFIHLLDYTFHLFSLSFFLFSFCFAFAFICLQIGKTMTGRGYTLTHKHCDFLLLCIFLLIFPKDFWQVCKLYTFTQLGKYTRPYCQGARIQTNSWIDNFTMFFHSSIHRIILDMVVLCVPAPHSIHVYVDFVVAGYIKAR